MERKWRDITIEALQKCFEYGINSKFIEPGDGKEVTVMDVDRYIAEVFGKQERLFDEPEQK